MWQGKYGGVMIMYNEVCKGISYKPPGHWRSPSVKISPARECLTYLMAGRAFFLMWDRWSAVVRERGRAWNKAEQSNGGRQWWTDEQCWRWHRSARQQSLGWCWQDLDVWPASVHVAGAPTHLQPVPAVLSYICRLCLGSAAAVREATGAFLCSRCQCWWWWWYGRTSRVAVTNQMLEQCTY